MNPTRRQVASLGLATLAFPGAARASQQPPPIFAVPPGAPGREFYAAAVAGGADFLSTPVSVSSDGMLVAAPGVELSAFTDIAARPEFADRRKQRTLAGAAAQGWFVDDFTLAELKTLLTGKIRKSGRAPAAPPNLLSLQEVVDIARAGSVGTARTIGVAPYLVQPAYFIERELAVEPRLADFIRRSGYDSPAAAMIVHAAEPSSLRTLSGLTRARRVQIIGADSAAMVTGDGLAATRAWAGAIAADDALIVQPGTRGAITSTGLVQAAHAAGLKIYALASSDQPEGRYGAPLRPRLEALFVAGADGVECQDAGLAARARDDAIARLRRRAGLD